MVTSATDVDNNLTNATDYDALGRALKTKAAVGTANEIWTQSEYDDVNRRIISRSDLYAKGDGKKIGVQHYDQLGRVRLTRSIENAATQNPYNETDGIKVQTRYRYDNGANPAASNGSYTLTSNPYRAATSGAAGGEPSMGWTRSKAVNTGRHSEAETFTGAALPAPWGTNANSTGVVTTDVDANAVSVTDQAGKQRRSITNGLGQLIRVDEPTAAGLGTITSPTQPTYYGYDTLNNLTTVNQGGQTRTFSYSSLSRLKSATNPESGAISYVCDDNGNLTSKTDARGVQTSFVYDALNRVTARNYNDGTPNVTYTYDNLPNAKGKLTKVENAVSRTEYQVFDTLGRVTQSRQFTDGVAYGEAMTYTYNFSGAMVEQKYPSGRVVKNVLDNDGRLSMVQSKKNANSGFFNYAKNFTYTAAGAVSSMQLGNGKWESTQFNSRLQPTQIALGTVQNGTDKLKLDFSYGTANNNGNVQSQTITVPTTGTTNGFTAVQTYNYDELNRLKSATEIIGGAQSWKQTFTFDRYGNRNFDASQTTTIPAGCAVAVCNPTVDPATNRLVGYTFDTAGNTKVDASGKTFTYDAENKQTLVKNSSNQTIGEYFYDGDGKRVKKIAGGEETIFIYDAAGKLVAEYTNQMSDDSQISYLTNDHLGSPRITTDADGKVFSRRDFLPFGEEIDSTDTWQRSVSLNYGEDGLRQKFTSYERDSETDLDFAEARYYKSAHGRFTSTDPIIMSYERAVDPQRINLYGYSRNNPLKYFDPDGEDIEEPNGLSDEDQKAYEKWRDKFLSTEEGRKTWDKYKNDKNFTLKIVVADRGSDSQNRSAKVGDYVFDGDGNFTGATMTLGRNLGKGLPGNSEDYPVLSALDTENSADIGASKIAHEFGHLDDLKSLGKTFYEQQKILDPYGERIRELGRQNAYDKLGTDPTLNKLKADFKKAFGVDIAQEGTNRERRAEKQAIPTIRQIFGKSLSSGAKKAIKQLEGGN